MRRLSLAFVLLVTLLASRAEAQTTLELDRIGVQQHRDYLRLQPFEQIDTQASNLIITLTDLVLPGNAGHDLRFQLTYNSESDTGDAIWRFGIPGVPMKVRQEQSWPTPGSTIQNTLDATRGITPVLEMADGARYRTVFSQTPVSNDRNTMNEAWTSRFWRYHRDTHTLELPDGMVCTYDPATLQLTQIADAYGNLVILTWSAGALQVQQILKNEPARTVSFAMNDTTSLPITMTFNDGSHDRVWYYAYEGDPGDSTGRLREITPPLGPHWRFDYEDFEGYRRLAHLTTPHGGRIDYGYEIKHFVLDGQPEITRALLNARDVVDRGAASSNGHWSIRCDWYSGDTFCHQTTIQTPSARLTYYYGALGVAHPATIIEGPYGLTRVTIQDPAGATTFEDESRNYIELPVIGSTYRSAELSSRWIDRGGRSYSTTFSYDTADPTSQYHCPMAVTEIGELTRTVARHYVHYRNQPFIPCLPLDETVTVGAEWVSRYFQYDDKGFHIRATEFGVYLNSLPLVYARDDGGNVASATRRGMTTTFGYSGGRQARVSTPLTTITRTINADGTVASETAGGRTTTFQYDDLSRVTLRSPPGGTNPVITDYDNSDGSWVREARGTATTTTTLDGFGRSTRTQDSAGVQTATEYDAEGRVAYEGYPFTGTNGPRSAIEYDALGRVTRRTNPDNTFSTHTYAPGTVTLTDENGHQTVQTWEAFGHPDDGRMTSLLDADQKRWSYGYHVLGELWTVVAPDGRTRTWLYNEQHLLSSETHPETGTTTYRYDSAGRLSQKSDANNVTTTYTYDANNRIQSIAAGLHVTAFGYENGSDNRQWASSGGIGSIDHLFTFDDAGRLASRTAYVDGKVFTTQFEYDGNDALTAIEYPTIGGLANRRTVRYDLDAERRVTRVFDATAGRNYATGFTYHPSGGITSYTAGNGVSTTITYDPARYWITGIHSGALQLDYDGHDNAGNVTSIGDVRGGMNLTFGYDALDRLTSVNGPYSTQYAYDVHGNRQDPNNGAAYQYDSNTLRLMSQYGVPFTYDDNGNLKTAPGRSYAYTPENWLQTAVVNNVVHAYEYDADGWRLKKVTPAGVTYYLRGLNGELLTEWTNPGPSGVIRDYIYAGSRLLAAITTSSSSLDTGDIVGTITVGGSPVWLTIASANQQGRLFLNGTAGQAVDVAISSVTPFNCNWTMSLLAPDGTAVTSITPCAGTIANTGPRVLPTTGTYVVLVDPAGTVTGSISVAATDHAPTTPTIATISPMVGVAGGTVTITGTNLTPLSAVRLNGLTAVVVSSSSAAVTFTVPALATSGRITVSTPSGQAVSSDDFFVSPYAPSDIGGVGRLNVGSGTTFTIAAANQVGLFVFDRAAGQRFSLTISNQTIQRLHLQVLRPDGVVIYASGAVYPFSPYFTDVKVAPVTGTYTLVIDADDAFTGTATVTLADVPRDVSGDVVPGGAPVSFTVSTAGQNARLSFVGTTGQRVALTTTNTTIAYSGVTVRAPDGSQVLYGPMGNNNWVGPVYLPLTGAYDILVDPFEAYTGTMTITLYNVEPDVLQSIPTDGTPTTITQSVFQRAYLTFTGAVGQHLNGTITGKSTSGCGRFGYVADPNNRSMYGVFCADGNTFPDTTLTVAGTYTISLDPNWTATGTYVVRVTVSSVRVTSVSPTSGPIGSTITIAGSGFGASQGSSTVTFNGIAASVSAWSSTGITVSVPAGATTGPVVVTVGGQASNAVGFTVLQPPIITSVNPTVGVAAQSITITGSNFGAVQGNSTVTFNGVIATVTSWSTTSIIAIVPAAATTGPVLVTVAGMASAGSTFVVLKEITYHLHTEASDINRLLRLRSSAPDAAATTLQSGNIGNSTGEIAIKSFVTDPGIPGAAGSIPSGTPLTFVVYLGKTTGKGVIYPRVRARLNSDTGALLCQATGTMPLTATVTRYALSCTTSSITMTSSDRVYLWVGVNVTATPGGNTRGELAIEGTNGASDSFVTVQIPR